MPQLNELSTAGYKNTIFIMYAPETSKRTYPFLKLFLPRWIKSLFNFSYVVNCNDGSFIAFLMIMFFYSDFFSKVSSLLIQGQVSMFMLFLQEWIFMNCWTSHRGIEESIMMMLLLW